MTNERIQAIDNLREGQRALLRADIAWSKCHSAMVERIERRLAQNAQPPSPQRGSIRDVVDAHILAVVSVSKNTTEAARVLGISPSMVAKHLKRLS